jgi:hypothetical protein
MDIWDFYYCVHTFFSAFISMDSNSASNFAFYDTHIECLPKKLFGLYKHVLLTLSETRTIRG